MAHYVTTNIRLNRDLHKKLRYEALEEGKRFAELVREAVRQYLEGSAPKQAELNRLADAQRKALQFLAGITDSGLPDLGRCHDEYLYHRGKQ